MSCKEMGAHRYEAIEDTRGNATAWMGSRLTSLLSYQYAFILGVLGECKDLIVNLCVLKAIFQNKIVT